MSMAMIGVRFDLRAPAFGTATHAELYAACLEQCAWADGQGLDLVVLSEHHGVDDGYLPAPLTLAAAIAGRTKRININIAALLVPLHDPVRLAEELAVLDLASGSRVGFVAGLGYRDEEFAMAGVDRKARGRLLEEYVDVLRRAWTGEPFEWRGRTIRVTPKPRSEPLMLVGGSTAAAARRAARLRLGFFPAIGDPRLAEVYQEECARLGFAGFVSLPGGPGFVHVSEDPEREWARIGPHALYDAQTYAAWQPPGQRSAMHVEARTVDDVRRSSAYRIVTPEECVALARESGRIVLHPLMGGMPPALGWQGLTLFAEKVLPHIRS
jgi:alkanesulfonate monooxygenase SsuD/methylene tetrahydromethanopterin reductase-like flavin-dependent oxidoreductase (luciferase family)